MQREFWLYSLGALEAFVSFLLAMQVLGTKIRSHRNLFFLFFSLSLFQAAFVVGWAMGQKL